VPQDLKIALTGPPKIALAGPSGTPLLQGVGLCTGKALFVHETLLLPATFFQGRPDPQNPILGIFEGSRGSREEVT
jgi:hypothetical protein